MKNLKAIKAMLIFCVLYTSLLAVPNWYLKPTENIVGYGRDVQLLSARKMARIELSQVYNSDIISERFSHETKDSLDITFSDSIISNNELSDTSITHEENIDGEWFVAIKYNNKPIASRVINKINKIEVLNINIPLSRTPLYQDISNYVGYNFKVNIYQFDNNYYFKANNIQARFRKNEIQSLYYTYSGSSEIKLNKRVFRDNDALMFKVSSKKRYCTVFTSDSKGRVGILYKNKMTRDMRTFKKVRDRTTIDLVAEESVASEMIIAIFTDRKLSFDLEAINENVLDSSNLELNTMFKLMSNNEYSTVKYKIKK